MQYIFPNFLRLLFFFSLSFEFKKKKCHPLWWKYSIVNALISYNFPAFIINYTEVLLVELDPTWEIENTSKKTWLFIIHWEKYRKVTRTKYMTIICNVHVWSCSYVERKCKLHTGCMLSIKRFWRRFCVLLRTILQGISSNGVYYVRVSIFLNYFL